MSVPCVVGCSVISAARESSLDLCNRVVCVLLSAQKMKLMAFLGFGGDARMSWTFRHMGAECLFLTVVDIIPLTD